MHFNRFLLALPLTAGSFANSFHVRDDEKPVQDIKINKQFIIQVEPGTNLEGLKKELSSNNQAKILKTFDSDVFTGVTIESDGYNVDTLNSIDAVKQSWPVSKVELPPLEDLAELVQVNEASNYSIHSWTGVDKAHEAGILGKGVKVAIVDTGIEYTHDALGGGFGASYKVSGGYDLVGDGNWPIGALAPDDDPMDKRGHGTHVAGIVAGKTDWFTGVAPEAELLAYKVFSTDSNTYDNILIEAFIMAYEAGADIITCSVGAAGGWSNGPWATVASNIAEKGVIVTIAASNSGSYGPFYANSGSSGKDVLAIASAKAGTLAASPFELSLTLDGKTTTSQVGYRYNYYPWTFKGMKIYPLYNDTTRDNQACTTDDIPENTPDLSDVIVLIKRGQCDYLDQEFNLISHNVTQLMFYNNGSSPDDPISWLSRSKALVEKEVGEAIVETIKAGGEATVDFQKYADAKWYMGMYNGVGNRPSYFTSWGGLFDMDLKPDVAAPGGEILSSWLGNTWRIASGTSMATPYAAGVAALYLSKFGGRATQGAGVSKAFNNKVITGGSSMPWSTVDKTYPDDTGFWAPTIQAGSGLLNAWKLLTYTTTLGSSKWLLNDTEHFTGTHSVEVTNNADTEAEYEFNLQPAAGVQAAPSSGVGVALLNQINPVEMVPSVSMPSGTFKVGAGETKTAEFTFDYPRGLDESKQPLYSGKVLISSSLGEQLSIPYFGAAYSLREAYKDIFIAGTPYIRSPTYDITQKSNFTFDVRLDGSTKQDYPKAYASFAFGCDELRWDIYESGWKESSWSFPPVVGEGGYLGAATSFRDSGIKTYFDPTKDDKENTVPFPIRATPRNIISVPVAGYDQYRFFWLGKLANGSYINPGKYAMRFAALRPLGDRTVSTDWDIWDTPEITVLPLSD
uniref:Peptidase S8/S53 domain-containing protein n=1 Tax=Bionectria ochroleuca TaxID=29856 RepID=A0A8H7NL32_BIOOC